MSSSQPVDDLTAGRAALEAGAWQQAQHAFERALAIEETPEALEGLGLAAWWLDLADVVFDSRERAYRAYRSRGDHVVGRPRRGLDRLGQRRLPRRRRRRQRLAPARAPAAGRAARFARARVSRRRAPRSSPCSTTAIPKKPRRWPPKPSASARRSARSITRWSAGRCTGSRCVTTGRVTEGLRELDEVSAAILAGELSDRLLIGLAGCYLIGACDRVRDHGRAVQWCDRIKEHSRKWGLKPLFAVCRTQYASVCMWRGAWDEAERELTNACDELAICRPGMTTDGLARLGELRRRQGRLDEAAALFDRSGAHPIALAGTRGDRARPGRSRERRRARRAASAAAAGKEPHRARRRAGAVDPRARPRSDRTTISIARARRWRSFEASPRRRRRLPLLASASLAAGLIALAAGDLDVARRELEDAVDLFERSGAPFEAARARIDLARVMERLQSHRCRRRGSRSRARRTDASRRPPRDVALPQAVRDRLAASPHQPADRCRGPRHERPDGPRSRSAAADLERPQQPGDRRAAVHQRAHRAPARREYPRRSSTCRRGRPRSPRRRGSGCSSRGWPERAILHFPRKNDPIWRSGARRAPARFAS